MGHTLLSTETQLNNGNVFFEFRGRTAKPIIDLTFAEYKFDENKLVENLKGKNFWDEINTGTKYQLSAEGFMKHNTGPSKIMFDVSEQGIRKIVDHVITNAKNYLMGYTLTEGFYAGISEKSNFVEGSVDIGTILRYLNACKYSFRVDDAADAAKTMTAAIESINKIYKYRREWYDRFSGQLLALLIAIKATGARITSFNFWQNTFEVIAFNPKNRNYSFRFSLDFIATVHKAKKRTLLVCNYTTHLRVITMMPSIKS